MKQTVKLEHLLWVYPVIVLVMTVNNGSL